MVFYNTIKLYLKSLCTYSFSFEHEFFTYAIFPNYYFFFFFLQFNYILSCNIPPNIIDINLQSIHFYLFRSWMRCIYSNVIGMHNFCGNTYIFMHTNTYFTYTYLCFIFFFHLCIRHKVYNNLKLYIIHVILLEDIYLFPLNITRTKWALNVYSWNVLKNLSEKCSHK